MTAQPQRFNFRALVNVGIVAGILALVAHFGGQWLSVSPTTETPVAEAPAPASDSVATPNDAPSATVEAQPSLLNMPWLDTSHDQVLKVDGIECTYADDAGKDFCSRLIAKTLERRDSGYYEANRPSAPVRTAMAPSLNDGGYLGSLPRGGNYVPEHWPAELRALLQYPSGLRSQQWAQENLP